MHINKVIHLGRVEKVKLMFCGQKLKVAKKCDSYKRSLSLLGKEFIIKVEIGRGKLGGANDKRHNIVRKKLSVALVT